MTTSRRSVRCSPHTLRQSSARCLGFVREGDVLIVTKLDRLARSASHLHQIVEALNEKGVGFRVVDDPSLDTTTRTGKLVFGILASIAEFETALRRERQLEGIAKAKEEGRTGGRPALITDDVRATIVRLKGEDNSVRQIAAIRKSFDINIEAMLFGRATPDTLCAC